MKLLIATLYTITMASIGVGIWAFVQLFFGA